MQISDSRSVRSKGGSPCTSMRSRGPQTESGQARVPAPAGAMNHDDSWRWNESVAASRRSVFYTRFIRLTAWMYVALVLAPNPVALVLGAQGFPRFVGPALLYILWPGILALFLRHPRRTGREFRHRSLCHGIYAGRSRSRCETR